MNGYIPLNAQHRVNATKLRYFQYRLLNKDILTNVRRAKWADISTKCSFCQCEEETILHIFLECEIVNKIWSALRKWFQKKSKQSVVTKTEIILNNTEDQFANVIILIIKQYIYASKCQNKTPSFIGAMAKIWKYY